VRVAAEYVDLLGLVSLGGFDVDPDGLLEGGSSWTEIVPG
jgi:hypothetical protein